MTQLLIWGEARELVSGELPAGMRVAQVTSLATLLAALDARGSALVLADAACLDAERDAVAAWLQAGGSALASLVAVAEGGADDELLRRLPFVDDIVARPLTPARVQLKLKRTVETTQSRRAIRQLEGALARKGDELSVLNNLGMQLSAERDITKLLELILKKSREITSADAGSLYLVERAEEGSGGRDQLRFKLAQNDTVVVPFEEFPMPLDKGSIAGYVAVSGEPVNVPDAYRLPEGSSFRISRSFDEKSGYRTKSMLVVPMRDHKDTVIGVVQLINKKRDRDAVLQPVSLIEEAVIPFTTTDQDLVRSLASQAAVAYENVQLLGDITTLFDRFVRAAAKAVEARDPVTSGHSERVAELTVALAERVDRLATGPYAGTRFTPEQVQEIRYAGLLHDFGKVAVQEKVLGKRKKLYATRMVAVKQRFAYILKSFEADYLRARMEAAASGRAGADELAALEADYLRRRAENERVLQAVVRANEPTIVEEESFAALMNLPTRRFPDHHAEDDFPVENWAQEPHLSADEIESLSIRRGTLTPAERKEIESHVSHTYEFLRQIPWTGEFRNIPQIAWAHHEKLDGSGYPRGIRAAEIPVQSRMMTISDIFDALVALDRPYKKAATLEEALGILQREACRGQLDADLLGVFVEAKLFELPAFTALLRPRA
jgi:HD-GYP domain-containing protein (c-di-GMP phosphodiesterase class II)